MPRLLSLALCLLLLAGCAAPPELPSAAGPLPPEFPPSYSLQAQLEAFRGEERTSRTCFEAVQTAQGFYYADSTGQRYLFLLEGADAYALYLWDREGALTPSAAAPFTRQALAGFQETLLDLGLLARDTGSLAQTGAGSVAGRPCQRYAGWDGAQRQTCLVDRETGLALAYCVQYDGADGQTYTYRFTCGRFATGDVQLPDAGDLSIQKGEHRGPTPAMFPRFSQPMAQTSP